MRAQKLVERLTAQATEIGYLLRDLEADEKWKSAAAQRALPMLIRDVRAVLGEPVDNAPSGFYDSLQPVVESIDQAAGLVAEAIAGKALKGFAVQESRVLLHSLGFVHDYGAEPQAIEEPAAPSAIDFVTLLQCAAMVNKSKRTLERWKENDPAFPTPEIIGDNGQADEWRWPTIRTYLETKGNRRLPQTFPAHVAR